MTGERNNYVRFVESGFASSYHVDCEGLMTWEMIVWRNMKGE